MVEIEEIKNISIFQDLTDNEIEKIKHLFHEKDYPRGRTLFFEGMSGGIMYLVKSGKIEIFKKIEGEEVLLASLCAGSFLGEMSLFDDEPRSAGARVAENTVLLVITKKNFQGILKISPEGSNKILMSLLKIISQRLRETNRKLSAKS